MDMEYLMEAIKLLVEALKAGEVDIEVSGPLSKFIRKIRFVGPAAWIIAIGAIGIASASLPLITASGGTLAPVMVPSALITVPALTTTIGAPAAAVAITMAVTGGGVHILNTLRSYNLEEISDDKIILHKR